MIEFTVYGEPVGKGRPKFGGGRTYTPAKTVNYEQAVKQAFITKYPDHAPYPKDVPLYVGITAYFSIPSSVSNRKKEMMEKWKIYPCKRPDGDNILKVICDACNKLIYYDDAQVIDSAVRKVYSTQPRVEVRIYPIDAIMGEKV